MLDRALDPGSTEIGRCPQMSNTILKAQTDAVTCSEGYLDVYKDTRNKKNIKTMARNVPFARTLARNIPLQAEVRYRLAHSVAQWA